MKYKRFNLYFYAFLLIISLTTLYGAFFIEYALQTPVCSLCVYSRFSYMLVAFLSIIGIHNSTVKINKYLIITLLMACLLSIYHTLIEKNILELSAICTGQSIFINQAPQKYFLDLLESQNTIQCNSAAVKILYFSLAEWNIMINIFLTLFICFASKFENQITKCLDHFLTKKK